LKIKVLLFLILLILANINLVFAEPVEKNYGKVNAWFNGNEATVENIELKINEPSEIKINVTSKINGHVAIYLDSPLVTKSYRVSVGPSEMDEWIDVLNVESGWTETYTWEIVPTGEWSNGNAPINIFVQFTKAADDNEKIDFTIANPYILDEQYSGPAPTHTADPSSTDKPPSQGSSGFGVVCALLGIAL
jgi:sarcinarray family protein